MSISYVSVTLPVSNFFVNNPLHFINTSSQCEIWLFVKGLIITLGQADGHISQPSDVNQFLQVYFCECNEGELNKAQISEECKEHVMYDW